jgi:aromatic-L-amino-acid decarboxylase
MREFTQAGVELIGSPAPQGTVEVIEVLEATLSAAGLDRAHVELAQWFARRIEESPDFELAAPAPLNLVFFRHRGGEAVGRELMERLNRSGSLYLTHTSLDGKFTLRLCVGQTWTEEKHVRAAWEQIRETAREIGAL